MLAAVGEAVGGDVQDRRDLGLIEAQRAPPMTQGARGR